MGFGVRIDEVRIYISNILNNKRNDTSFSVQNITTKAVLKNSDRCHISLLFVTITETLTTQTKLSQSPYSRRKDPK